MRSKIAVSIIILMFIAATASTVTAVQGSSERSPQAFLNGTVWAQINSDGFGNYKNTGINSISDFGGKLVAGTHNGSEMGGGEVWQRGSSGWVKLSDGGFDDETNVGVDMLFGFNDYLYAGTENYIGESGTNGGDILRAESTGLDWWDLVVHKGADGYQDLSNYEFFLLFTAYSSPQQICATTISDSVKHGAEIWCSQDGSDWTRIISNGFGHLTNSGVTSQASFGGALYFGTNTFGEDAEVWKTGVDLGNPVEITPGFQFPGNTAISSLEVYDGYLYAATHHAAGRGIEVWRCQQCNGSDWFQVIADGLGNADTRRMPGLSSCDGKLFLAAGNNVTGLEIWESMTGDEGSWIQDAGGGFNDLNNQTGYWGNSVHCFGDNLYIGTYNAATGGEVWTLLDDKVYIPAVLK